MTDNPYSVSPRSADTIEGDVSTSQRLESWVAGGLVGFFVCLLLVVFFFGVVMLFTGRLDIAASGSPNRHGLWGWAMAFGAAFSVCTALIVGINTTMRMQRVFRRRSRQTERQLQMARDAAAAKKQISLQKQSLPADSHGNA
ncbi:MAG: hypothetical protein R3C19_11645 [Planctomycetaceae bacterium]